MINAAPVESLLLFTRVEQRSRCLFTVVVEPSRLIPEFSSILLKSL
jgi:hypothetical protein